MYLSNKTDDEYFKLVLPACKEVRGESHQDNCSAYFLATCTSSYMRENQLMSFDIALSVANYINLKCKEVGMATFLDMKSYEEAVYKICKKAKLELDHNFPFSEVMFLTESAFLSLEEIQGLCSRTTRMYDTEYGYVMSRMTQEEENLFDVSYAQFGYFSKSDIARIKRRDFHQELLENCYGFRELLEKVELEQKVGDALVSATVKL